MRLGAANPLFFYKLMLTICEAISRDSTCICLSSFIKRKECSEMTSGTFTISPKKYPVINGLVRSLLAHIINIYDRLYLNKRYYGSHYRFITNYF